MKLTPYLSTLTTQTIRLGVGAMTIGGLALIGVALLVPVTLIVSLVIPTALFEGLDRSEVLAEALRFFGSGLALLIPFCLALQTRVQVKDAAAR